jgi:hypothetical protein
MAELLLATRSCTRGTRNNKERVDNDKLQGWQHEPKGTVHGAWCVVHGAWCMVHGAWCKVQGTRRKKGNGEGDGKKRQEMVSERSTEKKN